MADFKITQFLRGQYGQHSSESYFFTGNDLPEALTNARAVGKARLDCCGNGTSCAALSVTDYTSFFTPPTVRPFPSQVITMGHVAGGVHLAVPSKPLRDVDDLDPDSDAREINEILLGDVVDEGRVARHVSFVSQGQRKRNFMLNFLPDSISTLSSNPVVLGSPAYQNAWSQWKKRYDTWATMLQSNNKWKIMAADRSQVRRQVATYGLDGEGNVTVSVLNAGAPYFSRGDKIKIRKAQIKNQKGRRVQIFEVKNVDALIDTSVTPNVKYGDNVVLNCSSGFEVNDCKISTIEKVVYQLDPIVRVDLRLPSHRRLSKKN